jgi:hypothetical protein
VVQVVSTYRDCFALNSSKVVLVWCRRGVQTFRYLGMLPGSTE